MGRKFDYDYWWINNGDFNDRGTGSPLGVMGMFWVYMVAGVVNSVNILKTVEFVHLKW